MVSAGTGSPWSTSIPEIWRPRWRSLALLEHNPNYSAAYFHGGQTLEKLGRIDEARALYRRGIDVTGATGDAHTQSELRAALNLLG
jgi:tetratricopeptide (TPR) repeat protein